MNIQHSQQIQHIRYARAYRNDQATSGTGSHRAGRAAGIAVASVAAIAATMTFGGPASASYPSDDGPSAHVTRPAAEPPPSVSSPCFGVRTPDRWANDVGSAPRCTHTYGATDTGFAFTGQPAAHAESSADWYGYQAKAQQSATAVMPRTADFYEHQARAAEAASTQMSADRWDHEFAIQVTQPIAVPFVDVYFSGSGSDYYDYPGSASRWDHKYAAKSSDSSTTDDQHWRTCFTRFGSYQAWQAAQVGMPRCDIFGAAPERQ
jgi:hypothetical protein